MELGFELCIYVGTECSEKEMHGWVIYLKKSIYIYMKYGWFTWTCGFKWTVTSNPYICVEKYVITCEINPQILKKKKTKQNCNAFILVQSP